MNTTVKECPQSAADEWNAKVHVGDEVDYRGYPEAEPQRFKPRSEATVLSGHTAVVWLAGKTGCVTCESCTPVGKGGAL